MSIAAPAIITPKDRINPRSRALGTVFSRDRLHMVDRDASATAAFAMLDKVQGEAPELAYAAIALLFATMSERLSVDPQDGHAFGLRLLQHQPYHHKSNVQIEAMVDLAKTQWQGKVL